MGACSMAVKHSASPTRNFDIKRVYVRLQEVYIQKNGLNIGTEPRLDFSVFGRVLFSNNELDINWQSHTMSFSGLSREVRDLIYHALLCPPDGVQIHSDFTRWMKKVEATKTTSHSYDNSGGDPDKHVDDSGEEHGKEGNGTEIDRWGNSNSLASSDVPVPTAIFYVNHQIRQEATEVFYSFNRFTFDSDARSALKFLKGLRPSFRRQIRDIAFARESTSADDNDCRAFWDPLSTFIGSHMSLCSVTIQVPRDINHEIDETKEARPAPDEEWYWWPAVRLMGGLLMAGKIEKLRVGYCATLKIRVPEEEEPQDIEAGQSHHENPLESLSSISYLRHPQPQDELDREYRGHMDLRRAFSEQRSHRFPSFGALYAHQERRRQRFDFVVNQEDDPIGDVGTVLVLTRPAAS